MNDRIPVSDADLDDDERAAFATERAFARRELAGDLASLGANASVAAVCVVYYASTKGETGLLAAGIGAIACVLGTALSLIPHRFVERPLRPLVRSVAGLALRAGLPLAAILWSKVSRPDLMDDGLLTTIVAAYVAGWLVEAGWRMTTRGAALRRADDERRGSKTVPTLL